MKLDKLGLISKYEVIRETDLGYMLKSPGDEDEFFLHRNETNFKKLYPGDTVDAFLYLDKQKRPALTLYLPLATIFKGALCDVVSVTSAGAFINIGISKDILMSSDDFGYEEMPKRGDKLPIKLRVKGENIYAKLLNKEEMLENI